MNDYPQLMDGDAAAQVLTITPRHLRELVRRGLLPVVKVGHLNRYRMSDLVEFIDRNVVVHADDPR